MLLVSVTPPLRNRFLAYGARAEGPTSSAEKEKAAEKKKQASFNIILRILDDIADWKVPHDYFWLFYFTSVVLSAFWPGEALYLRGPLYKLVVDSTRPLSTSMSFEQVKILWVMILVQGGRRMYESLTLSEGEQFGVEPKTNSKMWGGHLVLGVLFYVATSISFWIEGVRKLHLLYASCVSRLTRSTAAVEDHKLSYSDIIFKAPTFRTIISVLIFILASGFQHDCHTYLAYLKKTKSTKDDGSENDDENSYKLPTHPAFQPLICPHYTAECLIYLSLALVSAPQGAWINLTMASALVFVVVNLGVTAEFTKQWYERKFGREATRGKWRMIPPIF